MRNSKTFVLSIQCIRLDICQDLIYIRQCPSDAIPGTNLETWVIRLLKIDSRNKQRISQRSLLDDAVFPESVAELYCTLGEIGINTRREATTWQKTT